MIKPLNNLIILDITEFLLDEEGKREKKTASGIIIPGSAAKSDSKTMTVEVVAIPDKLETEIKVGDFIVVSKFHGHRYRDPETEREYALIPEDNILAIVPKPKEDE